MRSKFQQLHILTNGMVIGMCFEYYARVSNTIYPLICGTILFLISLTDILIPT